MKSVISRYLLMLSCLVFVVSPIRAGEYHSVHETGSRWRAGVARVVITPDSSVWMAGYASRNSPSEGVLHDLWAKALVLEDGSGHRSLLITMDILAIPKDFSDDLRGWINQKYGLDNSQIILSCSHTHSGPVISKALKDIYPMNEQDWERVGLYTEAFKDRLHGLVDKVMGSLHPVKIYTKNGTARFQVNRRNNSERSIEAATELRGPNDYAVPVIKVEKEDGKLMAIVFGYACHPTTLSINKFSGDYPGFAQIELENIYPGATAMFFQGAGADQNPMPRHTIPLAIQYGKQLAATVERVLSEEMELQENRLITRYTEASLMLEDPLPTGELQEISKRDTYEGRWARELVQKIQNNEQLIKTYPFPIGYWQIGKQQLFVLGGESVISYSIRLKEILGQQIFVMSYANDVMGYIPNPRILKEGRYEGDTSQRVYGLPAKWHESIEKVIIQEAEKLVPGSI